MTAFIDETVYPVNMSAGGINAYYVTGCDNAGCRPAFCICVNKLKAFDRDGALPGSDCENPIRYGNCMARAMRNEELKANRSIYFIHREKLKAHTVAGSAAPGADPVVAKRAPMVYPEYVLAQMGRSSESEPSKSSSLGKSSVTESFDDTGFASVINVSAAIVAPVVEKEASSERKPPVIEALHGESLLDMARRALKLKQESK